MKSYLRAALAVFFLLTISQEVFSDCCFWQSNGTYDWNTVTYWQDGGGRKIPGATDYAVVEGCNGGPDIKGGENISVLGLSLEMDSNTQANVSQEGTLHILSGGTGLEVAASCSNDVATYTFSGGGLYVCERTIVGSYSGSNGTFYNYGYNNYILAGQYNPGFLSVADGNGSHGTYRLQNSNWDSNNLVVADNEYIGKGGTGVFYQSSYGTNLVWGTVYLGYQSGSYGSYTMTGFGNLKAKTDVWVGYDGNGFFSHDGNSVAIVSGSLYVGAAASVTGVGKYTLFGNGILDMDGGGGNIHVGDSSGVGRFEWKSSTSAIRPQGGSMIIGANGTLAMGFNFGLGALLVDANSLFASRGTLDISAGQLEIFNTATATVEANRSVTIGKLNVVNGTLSMSSGSSLTVTNSLALDSNFVSADPNAKIIIQPPRGSNTASLNVAVTDPNKVAGLGNVTLQFQFDPNQTGTPQTVTLAVAGQPYDANKTVDQNFSTANYVINHLIVGRGDANTGNTGTLLKLAGNVYVKKLDILQGGNIDPNGFVSV